MVKRSNKRNQERFVHVYVLATVEDGAPVAPVKIGITSDPRGRLATLQTASPYEICMFCCLTMNQEWATGIEHDVHEILTKYRLKGEWFAVDPIQAAGVLCLWFAEQVEESAKGDTALMDTILEKSGFRKNAQCLREFHAYRERQVH